MSLLIRSEVLILSLVAKVRWGLFFAMPLPFSPQACRNAPTSLHILSYSPYIERLSKGDIMHCERWSLVAYAQADKTKYRQDS